MNRAERRALKFNPFSLNRVNYQPTIFTAMVDYNGIQKDIWEGWLESKYDSIFLENGLLGSTSDGFTLAIPLEMMGATYYTPDY